MLTILIRFTSPANLEGTGFLTWNHKGGDDDQWLYLPATRRVRRIASSIRHGSFMGTDFTYDDLREREVDEDDHRLLRSERWAGTDCYVVESVQTAHKTLWTLSDIRFNIGLDDRIFTERSLKSP